MNQNTSIPGLIVLWLYWLGSFLSRHLPRRVSYALADFLADIHYLLRRNPRRALLSNLEVVCRQNAVSEDPRRLARTIFRNFGRATVDFLRLSALDAGTLDREMSAEGLEKLESALQSGIGSILLTGHIGGWEVGAAYLSARGYSIAAVARDHSTEAVTDFFRRRRDRWQLRALRRWEGTGALTKMLERGECIAVLGDWDPEGRGAQATFFGRRTRVPFAYVKLATRTGGRILPGVVLRNPAGGYRVHLDDPIVLRPGDVRGTLDSCLRVLERYILENLTQWFAFNPIWPERETPSPHSSPASSRGVVDACNDEECA